MTFFVFFSFTNSDACTTKESDHRWAVGPMEIALLPSTDCVGFAVQIAHGIGEDAIRRRYLHNSRHEAVVYITDNAWVVVDSAARRPSPLRLGENSSPRKGIPTNESGREKP